MIRYSFYSKQRGDALKTILILFLGLLLGMVVMNLFFKVPVHRSKYVVNNKFKKSKFGEKKSQKYFSKDKLDSTLYNVEGKIHQYREKGLKFSSLTEAERFKTASFYHELKKNLSYQNRERLRAKKRFYKQGGNKLIEARKLIEQKRYDMAENLIKDTLREGGKYDPYVKMESFRYMAEIYREKQDVKKYALMMYKYFAQMEKEGISEEKEEAVMKQKEELKKMVERLKKQ
jgi:hypothetical protein